MAGVPAGERHLRIATRGLGHYGVELSITDYGTGIAESLVDRVFEPFVTSKRQGLGLGPSICRSIVAAHRGSLWSANTRTAAQRSASYCRPRQPAVWPVRRT